MFHIIHTITCLLELTFLYSVLLKSEAQADKRQTDLTQTGFKVHGFPKLNPLPLKT